jgi:hypothetical protein
LKTCSHFRRSSNGTAPMFSLHPGRKHKCTVRN